MVIYSKPVCHILFHSIVFIIGNQNINLFKYGITFIDVINSLQGIAGSNLIPLCRIGLYNVIPALKPSA